MSSLLDREQPKVFHYCAYVQHIKNKDYHLIFSELKVVSLWSLHCFTGLVHRYVNPYLLYIISHLYASKKDKQLALDLLK